MNTLLIVVVGIILVLLAAGMYRSHITNARVIDDLKANPSGERAARVMILTFPSGRELPVNYLKEGNQVFAGADGPWWRAFREGNVPVKVLIQGETLSGHARTVMDDKDYTLEVFARLRPDVPRWLPFWLNAYLVVIDLDD